MKNKLNFENIITITWLITVVIYIINFIQLIIHITEGNLDKALIKAIGVFTLLGSLITVWF